MIISKTRNANGWVTQQGNLIPNAVKCNEKHDNCKLGISSETKTGWENIFTPNEDCIWGSKSFTIQNQIICIKIKSNFLIY